ncbi:MAG: HDOD domain-containing protein [Actinomycetota bacterium]|nr:HDOD domain-containing protein [Actinomycetota bacterium]
MTVTAPPTPLDVQHLLASIDTMAAEKPIAAQLVGLASADDTSARELAAILAGDVALAGRVMKLANSAYWRRSGATASTRCG